MNSSATMRHAISSTAMLMLVGTLACRGAEAPANTTTVDRGSVSSIRILERGPTCGACTIVLEEVAVLGAPEDEFPIGDGSLLAVVSNARCVIAPTDRDGEALVFDRCAGTPSQFGRQGEGPGELTGIRTLHRWGDDSILAFGYGRLEVLSGASGRGRSVRFDPAIQGYTILPLANAGVVVVNSDRHTRPQFLILSSDGSTVDSFGAEAGVEHRGDSREHAAVLGIAALTREFWSGAPSYRYHLVRWNLEGQPLQTIQREPAWFTPYDSTALAAFWKVTGAVQRPLPSLRAIHETSDGLLFAAFGLAAEAWRPDSVLPPVQRSPHGEVVSRARTRPEHYDGVIEVLDASTGEFLISIRTDGVILGFPNDTLVYARRLGADDLQQIALFRIHLDRGAR